MGYVVIFLGSYSQEHRISFNADQKEKAYYIETRQTGSDRAPNT